MLLLPMSPTNQYSLYLDSFPSSSILIATKGPTKPNGSSRKCPRRMLPSAPRLTGESLQFFLFP